MHSDSSGAVLRRIGVEGSEGPRLAKGTGDGAMGAVAKSGRASLEGGLCVVKHVRVGRGE